MDLKKIVGNFDWRDSLETTDGRILRHLQGQYHMVLKDRKVEKVLQQTKDDADVGILCMGVGYWEAVWALKPVCGYFLCLVGMSTGDHSYT